MPFVAVLPAMQTAGRNAGAVPVWDPSSGKETYIQSGSTTTRLYDLFILEDALQDGVITGKGLKHRTRVWEVPATSLKCSPNGL